MQALLPTLPQRGLLLAVAAAVLPAPGCRHWLLSSRCAPCRGAGSLEQHPRHVLLAAGLGELGSGARRAMVIEWRCQPFAVIPNVARRQKRNAVSCGCTHLRRPATLIITPSSSFSGRREPMAA